jgi:hypothetical protein
MRASFGSMLILIVACEIAFWVLLLAGLAVRYGLRLRRTGAVLLAAAPAVDLVLLVAAIVRVRSGEQLRAVDGLAAVYLGVSVAYGHLMLRWADERFAHRFAGGPPPTRYDQPAAYARRQRELWLRHLLAFAVGSALLLAGAAFVRDPQGAQTLLSWIRRWAVVLGIDFAWSFSYTIWPRKALSRRGYPRVTSQP